MASCVSDMLADVKNGMEVSMEEEECLRSSPVPLCLHELSYVRAHDAEFLTSSILTIR